MSIVETVFGLSIVLSLSLILGVGIPSCMENHHKATLKCMELRPALAPVECYKGIQ